ncbi:MAG: hypothetical protein HY306_06265 [Nitrosomonadales bacterium]|nr:hypothetical protein [Nitrosomonadales bacterium]
MTLKRGHWIAIILVTIVLIVMAPSDDVAGARKNARPDKSGPNTSALSADRQTTRDAGRVEMALLDKLKAKPQEDSEVNDVFNHTSWYVPPPAPPAPPPVKFLEPIIALPPPEPTAPPLPFTYFGRYEDGNVRTVVLVKGGRVYAVKVGEILDGAYRVEDISQGVVTLTYLPLNTTQSLRTGETS